MKYKNEQNHPRIEAGFTLIEVLIVVLLTSLIIIALADLFDTNQKIYAAQQQVTNMNTQTRTAMEQMVTAIRTAGSNNLNAIRLSGKSFIAIAEDHRIRVVEDLPKDSNGDGDTFDKNELTGSSPDKYDGDDEDENADGYINDDYEDVTFSLVNGNLTRTQYINHDYDPNGQPNCIGCSGLAQRPAVSDIIAPDITSLTFEYFQDTSTVLTPPVTGNFLFNIKIVRVTVDARTHSFDRNQTVPSPGIGKLHTLRLTSDVFLRN